MTLEAVKIFLIVAASMAITTTAVAVSSTLPKVGPSATGKKNPAGVPYILQMSVDSSTTASTSNVQYGSSASCVEFAKTNKQCPTGDTPYLAIFPIGGGTANSSTGMQGLSATACQPVSISSNCPGSASSCYSLQTKSSYETAVGGATSGLQLSWVVYCCPNGNGCPSTTPIAQAQSIVPVVAQPYRICNFEFEFYDYSTNAFATFWSGEFGHYTCGLCSDSSSQPPSWSDWQSDYCLVCYNSVNDICWFGAHCPPYRESSEYTLSGWVCCNGTPVNATTCS